MYNELQSGSGTSSEHFCFLVLALEDHLCEYRVVCSPHIYMSSEDKYKCETSLKRHNICFPGGLQPTGKNPWLVYVD